LRRLFWESHPEYRNEHRTRKRQNEYKCDIRCAWVDYVDSLGKDGLIPQKLRNRATL
jgi:hypothetical protein